VAKDKRYNALKVYIESGNAKSLSELFDIVPKSVFVRDTGISYIRLADKIKSPEKFYAKDIFKIAALIGIDSRKIFHLIAIANEKRSRSRQM
jgi:hypothetical protein